MLRASDTGFLDIVRMFAPLCGVDQAKLIHLQYREQLLTVEITVVAHAFLDSRNLILKIIVNSRDCYSLK